MHMYYNSNRIGNDKCSEENETRMGESHHEVSGVTYMKCSDNEKEEVSPVSLGKNIPGRGRGRLAAGTGLEVEGRVGRR